MKNYLRTILLLLLYVVIGVSLIMFCSSVWIGITKGVWHFVALLPLPVTILFYRNVIEKV